MSLLTGLVGDTPSTQKHVVWCVKPRACYETRMFRVANSGQFVKKLEALTAFMADLEVDTNIIPEETATDKQH